MWLAIIKGVFQNEETKGYALLILYYVFHNYSECITKMPSTEISFIELSSN